jgi:hypothetical protein
MARIRRHSVTSIQGIEFKAACRSLSILLTRVRPSWL